MTIQQKDFKQKRGRFKNIQLDEITSAISMIASFILPEETKMIFCDVDATLSENRFAFFLADDIQWHCFQKFLCFAPSTYDCIFSDIQLRGIFETFEFSN